MTFETADYWKCCNEVKNVFASVTFFIVKQIYSCKLYVGKLDYRLHLLHNTSYAVNLHNYSKFIMAVYKVRYLGFQKTCCLTHKEKQFANKFEQKKFLGSGSPPLGKVAPHIDFVMSPTVISYSFLWKFPERSFTQGVCKFFY